MLKMMTVLALVMLTSAAPADDGKRQLADDKSSRELWWWHGDGASRTCRKSQNDVKPSFRGTLEAYICDSEVITASIKAKETDAGKAKWTVDIQKISEHLNVDDCKGGLNWHIHELRIPEDGTTGDSRVLIDGVPKGQCGKTGGHTDDSFACGGASHWRSTTCNAFTKDWVGSYKADKGAEYPRRCNLSAGKGTNPKFVVPDEDPFGVTTVGQAGCEYGDLSGKMGTIQILDEHGNFVTGEQEFEDEFIQPLKRYEYSSIVFHCGSPRIACANFDYDH
jgi:hypothetical protein